MTILLKGAISKLHGLQTESLSSVEKLAEERWSSVAAQLEQMLERYVCLRLSLSPKLADVIWMSSISVQQLAQRMEQKSADTSQQMEALSQDLDGMQAEVGLTIVDKTAELFTD